MFFINASVTLVFFAPITVFCILLAFFSAILVPTYKQVFFLKKLSNFLNIVSYKLFGSYLDYSILTYLFKFVALSKTYILETLIYKFKFFNLGNYLHSVKIAFWWLINKHTTLENSIQYFLDVINHSYMGIFRLRERYSVKDLNTSFFEKISLTFDLPKSLFYKNIRYGSSTHDNSFQSSSISRGRIHNAFFSNNSSYREPFYRSSHSKNELTEFVGDLLSPRIVYHNYSYTTVEFTNIKNLIGTLLQKSINFFSHAPELLVKLLPSRKSIEVVNSSTINEILKKGSSFIHSSKFNWCNYSDLFFNTYLSGVILVCTTLSFVTLIVYLVYGFVVLFTRSYLYVDSVTLHNHDAYTYLGNGNNLVYKACDVSN